MSEKLDLAFLAIGGPKGREWNKSHCRCDPEVGVEPCQYCAIHDALTEAAKNDDKIAECRGERRG